MCLKPDALRHRRSLLTEDQDRTALVRLTDERHDLGTRAGEVHVAHFHLMTQPGTIVQYAVDQGALGTVVGLSRTVGEIVLQQEQDVFHGWTKIFRRQHGRHWKSHLTRFEPKYSSGHGDSVLAPATPAGSMSAVFPAPQVASEGVLPRPVGNPSVLN